MIRKISLVIFLLSTVTLYSQKQHSIGIGVNSEINSGNLRIGIGGVYEHQLTKHHGFELGLNYRNKRERFYYTIPTLAMVNQLIDIREDYLSLPVLYKFYSNIVNVSTGLTFDYFVGWKNLTNLSNLEMTSYSRDPKLFIGWAFKIGKSIPLSTKFYLEPEIQFNPIFDHGYSYFGGYLKLKYKL